MQKRMNWQAVSFDWNQARAFLATVDEGSLSAAARALGLTQPTLGRQVAAFEDRLGLVLFERVGRSLVPTPSALELVDHVRAMRDAAARLSLSASGQSQAIEGRVRLTTSDVMAAYMLPPALKELREAAPRLEIDLVATNDIQDLRLREADVAIRHVRPDQPELIARLVREATASFYAATDYLDRHGRPGAPGDLARHSIIGLGDNARLIDWLKPFGLGLSADNFRLGSASGVVSWELAQRGMGVVIMADEVAESVPGMERVLPDMAPFTFPIWLTAHRELHSSRRIRLVFDLLAEFLSQRRS